MFGAEGHRARLGVLQLNCPNCLWPEAVLGTPPVLGKDLGAVFMIRLSVFSAPYYTKILWITKEDGVRDKG